VITVSGTFRSPSERYSPKTAILTVTTKRPPIQVVVAGQRADASWLPKQSDTTPRLLIKSGTLTTALLVPAALTLVVAAVAPRAPARA
jgi:hypothetical protein